MKQVRDVLRLHNVKLSLSRIESATAVAKVPYAELKLAQLTMKIA